jgi:hypothetical protein
MRALPVVTSFLGLVALITPGAWTGPLVPVVMLLLGAILGHGLGVVQGRADGE